MFMYVSIVASLDIQQSAISECQYSLQDISRSVQCARRHQALSALSVREVVGVKSAARIVAWHRFAFLMLANFFSKVRCF